MKDEYVKCTLGLVVRGVGDYRRVVLNDYVQLPHRRPLLTNISSQQCIM